MVQGAVCLAKFKYCLDVHYKQQYNLGIHSFGSLYADAAMPVMDSQRYMFINWNCIMQLPIICISVIQVHEFYF